MFPASSGKWWPSGSSPRGTRSSASIGARGPTLPAAPGRRMGSARAKDGPGDATRESPEELNESEVDSRVQSVLDTRGLVAIGDQTTPLAQGRTSTRVSIVTLS